MLAGATKREVRKLSVHDGRTIIIYGESVIQERCVIVAMQVAVEFFGIPRARAGTASAMAQGTNLGDVLADLVRQFPSLGETCVDGRELRAGYIANLGAERFVTSSETPLREGDTVLLMSLDAGG
jgi:molybdopterin converting factor small subunit